MLLFDATCGVGPGGSDQRKAVGKVNGRNKPTKSGSQGAKAPRAGSVAEQAAQQIASIVAGDNRGDREN